MFDMVTYLILATILIIIFYGIIQILGHITLKRTPDLYRYESAKDELGDPVEKVVDLSERN